MKIAEIKKVFDISTGSLGIYANKIKFAKRLELIENDIFNDLKTMGEIRNLFAHSHKSLSFNDNKIIDKCDKLISCKKSLPPDVINSTNNSIDVMYQNTKQKFIHSFFNIAKLLMKDLSFNLLWVNQKNCLQKPC